MENDEEGRGGPPAWRKRATNMYGFPVAETTNLPHVALLAPVNRGKRRGGWSCGFACSSFTTVATLSALLEVRGVPAASKRNISVPDSCNDRRTNSSNALLPSRS
jgi:hypothetical protein